MAMMKLDFLLDQGMSLIFKEGILRQAAKVWELDLVSWCTGKSSWIIQSLYPKVFPDRFESLKNELPVNTLT